MKKTSFIDSLAAETLKDKGKAIDLSDKTFVFPNRRAGLFFTRALTLHSGDKGVILLPHVTDINRFAEENSPLRRADDTELLIWLFKAYTMVDNSEPEHHLKSFIELGTKILHDFNEIDKYLVDAAKLFRNIDDLNGITANLDEDIRYFYDTLLQPKESQPLEFHKRFASLWNIMFPLYETFRSLLRSQGIAYEGMIFRDLCDTEESPLFQQDITFAGFNILTESEKRIIEKFPNRRMVFDYNKLPRTDTDFDYLSLSIKQFGFNTPDNINAYPCMTSAEQGSSLRGVMNNLVKYSRAEDVEKNTAIVLADESMLIEALNNLPKEIEHLNITMGYPLANTQIANFINILIKMQLSIETDRDGLSKVYHKPLTDTLSHPYFRLICDNDPSSLLDNIRKNNTSHIPLRDLQTLDPDIFSRNNLPFSYLSTIFSKLQASITSDTTDSDTEVIDYEFIRQYCRQIESLRDYLAASGITADESETYALIRRLTQGMKVQFKGEPLSGLQVMGLLECRLLDFDNIVFVGFNDQFVPGNGSMTNSIIPYSLRKPYGLPSHEITNSIYAYNFYRMLHRCSRLDLIYGTATSDNSKCEVSRFYNQLRFIHDKDIENVNKKSSFTINENSNLFTPYFESPDNTLPRPRISASSLKKFICCPLRFYYEYILGVHQPDEIDDSISESVFGKLLHKALQHFYNDAHQNHKLSPEDTASLIDTVCEKAYADIVKQGHDHGYNILAFNSLKTIVTRIIQFDESREDFYDVQTEVNITENYSGFRINAYIDRLDCTGPDEYAVIDYKTSLNDMTSSLDRMFSMDVVKDYDLEVFQILFYCLVLSKNSKYANKRLIPHLFKAYSLTKDAGDKKMQYLKVDIDGKSTLVTDYNVIRERFESMVDTKLNELGDCLAKPELFLRCATNKDHCKYCPFRDLCLVSDSKAR